jgi:hypothetical protein
VEENVVQATYTEVVEADFHLVPTHQHKGMGEEGPQLV